MAECAYRWAEEEFKVLEIIAFCFVNPFAGEKINLFVLDFLDFLVLGNSETSIGYG